VIYPPLRTAAPGIQERAAGRLLEVGLKIIERRETNERLALLERAVEKGKFSQGRGVGGLVITVVPSPVVDKDGRIVSHQQDATS
jgi:hypothetical protein